MRNKIFLKKRDIKIMLKCLLCLIKRKYLNSRKNRIENPIFTRICKKNNIPFPWFLENFEARIGCFSGDASEIFYEKNLKCKTGFLITLRKKCLYFCYFKTFSSIFKDKKTLSIDRKMSEYFLRKSKETFVEMRRRYSKKQKRRNVFSFLDFLNDVFKKFIFVHLLQIFLL